MQPGQYENHYDNGQVKARGGYENSQMHGFWEFFRKDGSIMRSGHFDEGRRVGKWTTFTRDGRPYKVTDFGS